MQVRKHQYILSASILAADFTKLGDEVEQVLAAGIGYIHFDVMDHHFVPNLSFGPVVCRSLRKAGIGAPIDVHLMVEQPEKYIAAFAKAGANLIAFHPETTTNVPQTIQAIKNANMQAGLVFNPDKAIALDEATLEQIDMLLLMSVFPGFSGQPFIHDVLGKIKSARALIKQSGRPIRLGVDGGIKQDNIAAVAKAGADFFVVGSALFSANNYQRRINEFQSAIACKTI